MVLLYSRARMKIESESLLPVVTLTESSTDGQTHMLIRVHVTPNAREVSVTKVGESVFEVRVDERATHGRANKRLLEIMAKHLGVPRSKVFIARGVKTRDKMIEVVS